MSRRADTINRVTIPRPRSVPAGPPARRLQPLCQLQMTGPSLEDLLAINQPRELLLLLGRVGSVARRSGMRRHGFDRAFRLERLVSRSLREVPLSLAEPRRRSDT